MAAVMNVRLSLGDYHPGLSSVRAMLADVEALYRQLDAELALRDTTRQCRACGQCCDFEAFGHRLYLTTPELLYFAHRLGEPLMPMTGGDCPYRIDGMCHVYSLRFAGCRIFQCKGSASIQSEMTEATLAQLKALGAQHNIPYFYMDLKTALGALGP